MMAITMAGLALATTVCGATRLPAKTTLGPIVGTVETSDQGVEVAVFRGVPFAADTGGKNRWLPPQPRKPWTTPLDASKNGYGCVQPHHNPDVPCGGKNITGEKCESEDCLNVNVYCPRKASSSPNGYPVMFWIYGGAYNEGMNWGPLNLYDGTELAARGNVCVVGTNYRLGVLGFAVLSDTIRGNQAIQDQRAALQWTKSNIRNFGGDPTSVTIFGESAGAMSVSIHLVSPASKGLFQRAIMESNVAAFRYSKAIDQQNAFGNEFAKRANCTKGNLDCLRALDAKTAIELGEKVTGDALDGIIDRVLEGGRIEDALAMQWSPVVDEFGDDLPGLPLDLMRAGKWNPLPVLLGNNQDEGATFVYAAIKSALPELLFPLLNDAIFGAHGKAVTDFYRNTAKMWHDTRDSVSYMLTDYWFKCSSNFIAAEAAAAGQPAYVYRFEHVLSFASLFPKFGIPTICESRTCHMMEVPFVFHNHANYSFSEPEEGLANNIVGYWTSFAKTGDPNTAAHEGALKWPQYNRTNRLNLKISIPESIESTITGQQSGSNTVPPVSPLGVCEFYDSIGYGF